MGQAQMERKELFAVATLRQLFPAPLLGTQLVMVDPVASQVPVLAAPPQALCVSLSSAPPAPASVWILSHKILHNTCKNSIKNYDTQKLGDN